MYTTCILGNFQMNKKYIIIAAVVVALGAAAYYFNLIPGVGETPESVPCESNSTDSNATQDPRPE